MQVGTVDLNKLRSISDKVVGLGKESIGVLLNNDRLQKEGEAQQERAASEMKALKAELRAEKEDVKAKSAEKREVLAQRAKD